jgi:hypothetical protein
MVPLIRVSTNVIVEYPSQVNSLSNNNAFFIVQRATAQSKTRNFRDYGVAEAPPGFQAGWNIQLRLIRR